MALIHCDFFSETLGMCSSMYVILPQTTKGQIGMASVRNEEKIPTLYLLHGLSDDHTIWLRRTSIERYAASHGIAIVMPAVGRSFYADMKVSGLRYWTFVSEELPAIARSFFPLSDAREDNFAAGLSMGGYGAFKLALSHPDRFAAGASLSGALDLGSELEGEHPLFPEWKLIFGSKDDFTGGPNDLFHLAEQTSKADVQPMLYQCCGTEDFLYESNQRFLHHARNLGLKLEYEEEPGEHNWEYWDMKIQRVLNWLPIKGRTSV